LLDQKQDAGLLGSLEVHLEESQSFDEGIDDLALELTFLNENQMGAFQEGQKVAETVVQRLFEHSLDACV